MTMTTNNTELLNAIVETFAQQIAERAAQIIVTKYPAFDIARFEQMERDVAELVVANKTAEQTDDEPLTRQEVEHMIDSAMSSHTDDYDHIEEREIGRMIEGELDDRLTDAFREHEREGTHLTESDVAEMIEQDVAAKVLAAQKAVVTGIVTALQESTEG
jgi:hypothetical protein